MTRAELIYHRSRDRVDHLFERLNARIRSTVDEMHSSKEGFAPFMPPMTDEERQAWEEAWWNRKRAARDQEESAAQS